jgi:2-amino-4-hydroxy-6-hydroxymethyldihydropteridine diphosphokinase
MSNTPVAIALGSNLGDRRAYLDQAIAALASFIAPLAVSRVIETEPVDVPDAQPPYLNAVAAGETGLSVREVFDCLRAIEAAAGRTRQGVRAARTLDLDLILFGTEIIETADLTVPHPHFRDRRFVLEPLAEVAPDWRDPVSGTTVRQLLERLTA